MSEIILYLNRAEDVLFEEFNKILDENREGVEEDGVMFRRNFKVAERTLWPMAKDLYSQGKIRERFKTIDISDSQRLSISHLSGEGDAESNHAGAVYNFIGFHNLPEFTEYQFRYLLTRLRGYNYNTPCKMVATLQEDTLGWCEDLIPNINTPCYLYYENYKPKFYKTLEECPSSIKLRIEG